MPSILLGHDGVLERLRAAIARGRLGHAYLFAGPSGVGKRRVARLLAQSLLCERAAPPELRPCNACAACALVDAGAHPDLTEASKPADRHELPISLVQDLCRRLSLKPARGSWKIVVLDDADLLSEEAANCFLKTLEEPPQGSLLILVATSVETQLPTIVSRCQLASFSLLSDAHVAQALLAHRIVADPAEASRLARLASGSVGDACELASEEWRGVRERLLDGLAALPENAGALAQSLQSFVEEAGKDAAPRRARARQLVRLAANFLRAALIAGQTGRFPDDDADRGRAALLLERASPLVLADLIDRCLEADYHIGRFVQLALAVDGWIDDLAQILSGEYVPMIHAADRGY